MNEGVVRYSLLMLLCTTLHSNHYNLAKIHKLAYSPCGELCTLKVP